MTDVLLFSTPSTMSDVRLPARQVFDQGDVNACFSCALATCLEARDPACPALSALFHFHYAVRRWPDAIQRGIGDEKQAFGIFMDRGISSATLHVTAFSVSAVAGEPSPAARDEARSRIPRVDDFGQRPFRRLSGGPSTETRWKAALGRRQPILAVISTNAAYEAMRNGGSTRWSNTDRAFAGELHAVAVLGTSSADRAFIVQDSRGSGFGAGGQWLLPYDLAAGTAIDGSFSLEFPR